MPGDVERTRRRTTTLVISAPAVSAIARYFGRRAARVVLAGCAWLWLGCLLPGSTFSQTPSSHKVFGRYQQFVWREQQGLPQNTVQAITRTRDGYLWLGTLAGAARFDGAHFTVFDNGNTTAIKGSYITALLQDRQGDLWLTSDGGGLVRYRHGQFSLYTTRDGLPNETTKALLEDREGGLWVGTYGGLALLKGERFTVYTTREGLPHNEVRALAQDSEGGLWVGTSNGLARFKDGRFALYSTRDGLAHNYVLTLFPDQSGTLWAGTVNGLSRL